MTPVQRLDAAKLLAVCCHVLWCHLPCHSSLSLSDFESHWVCCLWHHPVLLIDSWDSGGHTDKMFKELLYVHMISLLLYDAWNLLILKKEKWTLTVIYILLMITTIQKMCFGVKCMSLSFGLSTSILFTFTKITYVIYQSASSQSHEKDILFCCVQ